MKCRWQAGAARLWLALALVAMLASTPVLAAGQAGEPEHAAKDEQGAGIGARFILTDHTGRSVTDQDFRGRYLLVFFGYTHCPDICPMGLQTIAAAMDLLGSAVARVQPLFVSLDPERDTPEMLAAYVASFHPRLIGLTGTPEMVQRVTKGYRVKSERIAQPSAEAYSIDHTAAIFLMGPDGGYIRRFAPGVTPEQMASSLRDVVAN
jgi:protein SCO1/2